MNVRCVWGGGETSTLTDIVLPDACVLSGSAWGIVKPKERLIKGNILDGDAIVLVESSGIHANGLTMAREITKKLPHGYLTTIGDGRTFGEALLDSAHIYVPFIESCLETHAEIHYTVHITGHGWRKLMRHPEPFVYSVELIPQLCPLFQFIQAHGPVDDREAYATFNMGAGFAVYCPEQTVKHVIEMAYFHGLNAFRAGKIKKEGDNKKVVIEPKRLEYDASTLTIR